MCPSKRGGIFKSMFTGQFLGLCCLILAGLESISVSAFDPEVSQAAEQHVPGAGDLLSRGSEVSLIGQIGFRGVWKLGHLSKLQVVIPQALLQQAADVHVTTLDGDGVEVTYRYRLATAISGSLATEPVESGKKNGDQHDTLVEVPIRIGRRQSVISVAIVDQAGTPVAREDQLLPDDSGLPPTQPLVLAIGSAMGLEDLVRTSADGSTVSMTLVELSSAAEIPQWWPEYQAVDLVVISAIGLKSFDVSDPKLAAGWQALDQWVRRGGTVVLSLNESLSSLDKLPFPEQWLPGGVEGEALIKSPAALESMIITDQPLQPFPALLVQPNNGQVRLNLTDVLGRQVPWWVTKPHGFGTIEVIATDLGHDSFAQWKHRRLLWERLVTPYFEKSILEGPKGGVAVGADSYLGYQDLSGQLRATLDLFPGVAIVSFSQVAAVLIAILVLIGPVDYWISVRWLKRPYLSWLFAGLTLLASVLGLTWYYQTIRPDQVLVNSACLVDIDPENNHINGHLWSHVYSARARQITVQGLHSRQGSPVYLDWQGLPGTGLGGLQSPMRIERGMPGYAVDYTCTNGAFVDKVGIPAAGTKCLVGFWSDSLSNEVVPGMRSSLRELSSVDQLEGEIVNPLSVDLRDTMLFYHRWYYPLRSRMPPGDRLVLSADVLPRDISRRLHRQQEVDGKLTTLRWNPAERNELDRLLELMMFYRVASGPSYTSLTHRYQPIVDHSNVLDSNYALLVGRLDSPAIELEIEPQNATEATTVSLASDRTWVRILLPVQSSKAANPGRVGSR
jgi:hypothetical protein